MNKSVLGLILPVAQNGVGHKESWGKVFHLRTFVLQEIFIYHWFQTNQFDISAS